MLPSGASRKLCKSQYLPVKRLSLSKCSFCTPKCAVLYTPCVYLTSAVSTIQTKVLHYWNSSFLHLNMSFNMATEYLHFINSVNNVSYLSLSTHLTLCSFVYDQHGFKWYPCRKQQNHCFSIGSEREIDVYFHIFPLCYYLTHILYIFTCKLLTIQVCLV